MFRVVDLPEGQECAYYPDLNVIAFDRNLPCEERKRVLDELQHQWRERHRPVVEAT